MNRTDNYVVIEAYFNLIYIAYVINASLGDSLVGVTFQPFNIIPYSVTMKDFAKVNSSCRKSFPPNLKSLKKTNNI